MAAIRWGNQACEDGGELRGSHCPPCVRVCVYVCTFFICIWQVFFFLPSLWSPVRLNTRSFAPVAEWQLWPCVRAAQSGPKRGRRRTASLSLCRGKKEFLMRPQLERNYSSISGKGHNRSIKGDYRKSNGKRASFFYFLISAHLLRNKNKRKKSPCWNQ